MTTQTHLARTAIGQAHGRHRVFLVATCVALIVAAAGDEATGYDGPGPFIYPAFAVVVALLPWRFTPLLAAAMSAFFLFGGLATPEFAQKLVHPSQVLEFAAGWLQMLGFLAAAGFAVAAVVTSDRRSSLMRRNTFLVLAGLLVGVVGLVVQWIANPAKFYPFPPGIAFLLGFGALVVLTRRWWWHPVFGVLIAFWIAGVGAIAGKLTPELASGNAGTVAGNVVMVCGLVLAFVAGVVGLVAARRA